MNLCSVGVAVINGNRCVDCGNCLRVCPADAFYVERYGLFSQLGFVPPGLKFDALAISRHSSEKDVRKHYVVQKDITIIRNSDAHNLTQMGEIYSIFNLSEINFSEIKLALNQRDNRFVEIG